MSKAEKEIDFRSVSIFHFYGETNTMENPIEKFRVWWQEALKDSPLQQKSAVCVSTIDEQGFPAARFVDLKSVDERGFIFCTYFCSAKGQQIKHNPNTALTIWWDHVGYQIRVVGTATIVTSNESDFLWKTRNRSAQLTTAAFKQSATLVSESELTIMFQEAESEYYNKPIPRPADWGGYRVDPTIIEFLTFKQSRLHFRELFERGDDAWHKRLLQP